LCEYVMNSTAEWSRQEPVMYIGPNGTKGWQSAWQSITGALPLHPATSPFGPLNMSPKMQPAAHHEIMAKLKPTPPTHPPCASQKRPGWHHQRPWSCWEQRSSPQGAWPSRHLLRRCRPCRTTYTQGSSQRCD
jgi:hypothetical protein